MNIVNDFRTYLYSQKKPTGTVTIKNYIADIKKFISWYETSFQISFEPQALSKEIISQYQTSIIQLQGHSMPAVSSVKRYLSSLRKFAAFLTDAKLIQLNPFEAVEKKVLLADPFYTKAFSNYLFSEQASKLTIKNYMNDIKQYLDWLEKVTTQDTDNFSSLLDKIDNHSLEEYKMRLLNEAKLSPVSINRKLSSLRRYTRWLEDRHLIYISNLAKIPKEQPQVHPQSIFETKQPMIRELPLTALQGLTEEKKEDDKPKYSSFGPLKLFQKTTRLINQGSDLLIFNPITNAVESIEYLLWKKGKKVIFAPVITILENSSYIPKSVTIKTIIPKEISMIPPRSANAASVHKKVTQYKIASSPNTVRNFTKALYAPLEISTEHMHWMDKLWHFARYKRPEWYKRYHTYPFVSYLHFAVLMIVLGFATSAIYYTWINGNTNQKILAAETAASLRTLTFQGRLLDNTNTPITTETPIVFNLYNSPTATGAAKLWTEKQDIKPDQNGFFTTTLGRVSRIEQSLFSDNPSLYIGISVNGNKELTPREEIPTTNYAANAKTVEGLKPITDSPNIAQNVLLALDSSGNLTIGGNAGHTFQATEGQLSLSGQSLLLNTNPGSNGNIQIIPDGSGIIDIQKPIQNTSNYSSPGGIPGAVEIADILSILATSSSQSALIVNQNGTGDIISGRHNGIDKFRLDNRGTAFFGGNIILSGDTINSTSTAFDIGGAAVSHLTIGSNATVVSLGASSGLTSVNNSLTVQGITSLDGAVNAFGRITANAGLTIPDGQYLTLDKFTPGAIPFIDAHSQVIQDAAHFNWNDTNSTLNVLGSLCINSVPGGTCNSSPGTITVKNNLNIQASADLAENYVSSQSLEPGDVVAAEGLSNSMAIVKSTTPYQKQLLGIISTKPGISLNSDATSDFEHPNVYPVALQGRVPVKVSSVNGPIEVGDELTSSSIPGVAMVASGSGQTIGKALEPYSNTDPTAVGKIIAFVNLSYRESSAIISIAGDLTVADKSQSGQNLNLDLSSDTAASVSAEQSQTSTTSANMNAAIASQSAALYNSIASGSATASSSSVAAETPTPTPLNGLQTNADLPVNFARPSQFSNELTYVPNLKSDYATFNSGLIALGPSSLTDVAVSDMIIVNNNLKITSDSLDTIGTDLNIQPLRQGNILFQGGLVAMDTQGNLKVSGNATFGKDVSVNGQLAANVIAPIPNHDLAINLKDKTNNVGSNLTINNSDGNQVVQINQRGDIIASGEASFNTIASQGFTIIRGAEADTSNTVTLANGSGGTGTISAHQTQRTIITPYVTSHSLIYVTATSNTGNIIPYVARQTAEDPTTGTKGSFSVEIPYTSSHDISFNWWIVN